MGNRWRAVLEIREETKTTVFAGKTMREREERNIVATVQLETLPNVRYFTICQIFSFK